MFFHLKIGKRPTNEINFLFKLIRTYFLKEINRVISQGIRVNILGDIEKLPTNLKKILKKSIHLTKKNRKITVNLAINYGSKNEIIMAIKKTKKVNIKNFESNLYTKSLPNPDILIRTGGHQRLSNFMLWQLAYAELFFLKNYGQILIKKIYKMLLKNLKKEKEILDLYDIK